ncbi:MAG: isopentenyl-diphosphate Delta-isomerase [Gammaproteobacteria bacterium]|nr:isopentenyl-diphosphate Delta-isomerase [Gammaproteobacteria bacterium]
MILVDADDNQVGTLEKVDCHLGAGRLHRAFSVFLFNPAGELLIQQRSAAKMLWGGYWANSCCSHPRAGEDTLAAAHRRLQEELGVSAELSYLYKFVYHAQFGDIGAEYENCWVFAGHFDGQVAINPEEISDWRFVTPAALTESIAADGERYTPWLKLEWERIRKDFLADLL